MYESDRWHTATKVVVVVLMVAVVVLALAGILVMGNDDRHLGQSLIGGAVVTLPFVFLARQQLAKYSA